MYRTASLPKHDVSQPVYSPRRCCTCGEHPDQHWETKDVEKRVWSRSITARQAGARRRDSIAPFSSTSLTGALRRLRRRNNVVQETKFCRCLCEAKSAVPTLAVPYENVYKRALKAVGGIVSMPSIPGSGGSWGPHKRGEASDDIKTNTRKDAQSGKDAQTNGAVGVLSARSYETTVAPRRCATTPDSHGKHRSTYSAPGGHTSNENESDQNPEMCDNMPLEPEANLVDLKSDLEWLEPIATFNRDFGIRSAEDDGSQARDTFQENTITMKETDAGNIVAMKTDDADTQTFERMQETGSPPELDAGYQTSDSGLSTADESMAEHLAPAQSMLELLSANVDGRFGSFYSVSNHSTLPEPQICEMDFACARSGMYQSRFSWGSSVYSDEADSTGDGDMWSKPIKPLVISKEAPLPPPIPERNPLRLLRKLSKGVPKGFGENIRASRNIHNLQLDLSRIGKEDVQNSVLDSKSSTRRSHAMDSKKRSKPAGDDTQPQSALPGHILHAMQSSTQNFDTPNKARGKKKARRSTKNNVTSATHSRSQSTREVMSGSTYAQQIMSARGHARAASEPFRQISVRGDNSCKWNESMPSDEPIRRSCIASLRNEHRSRKPAPALAINKQLPPLPVTLASS
jgi:hypothetical protein